MTEMNGAKAITQSLINHDVQYVFGIPGAKVDQLFDDLQYSKDPKTPKLIIARHEQNAAFMASGIGRLTGKPGIVAVTSGPGVTNLVTGLVTATAENDPIVAIGGQVKRDDLARLTHQSIASTALMAPTTKFTAEIQDANNLSEAFSNAYQISMQAKKGATFLSVPQNVLSDTVTRPVMKAPKPVRQGIPDPTDLKKLADAIRSAKLPVILTGMRASDDETAAGIRHFLKKVPLPVVETYQSAGVISHDLEDSYFGRVGLFRNQPGDLLLKKSDLVIAVGYDPIEYEARNWNHDRKGQIINLDSVLPELTADYQPDLILQGNIAASLEAVSDAFALGFTLSAETNTYLDSLRHKLEKRDVPPVSDNKDLVHPLSIVQELQKRVDDSMTVTVDVGSHYIWMARHFRSYEPRHLLFSNGMQTLGVALPWAISAALVRPNTQIVSVSGDGGFLFSGQELETAVREHLNIVHLIWDDGYYDMVRFQEKAKYGRESGVKFGPVDFAKYAESFGATGLRVDRDHSLSEVLDQAFATDGPVVVDIPVDYADNAELAKEMLPDKFN